MKPNTKKVVILAVASLAFGSFSERAKAAVTFIAREVNGQVVVSSSGGTMNLSGFGQFANGAPGNGSILAGGLYVGGNPGGNVDHFFVTAGNYTAPAFASPISVFSLAGNNEPTYGLDFFSGSGNLHIAVPDNYVFGSPLPDSLATYNNSLSDFGLSVGDSFQWTWNHASGSDSLTLLVVPESSSALFLGLGVTVLTTRRIKTNPW